MVPRKCRRALGGFRLGHGRRTGPGRRRGV